MNVRDRMANLTPRERNLVYAAGGMLGIAVLYLALVLPVQTTGAKLQTRVDKKTADLAWMRQNAPQVRAAAGAAQSGAGGESLVVLIDRTAREAGIASALRDQSPAGNAVLRVRIEAAQFDMLIAWLASLQQQYGVSVDDATFAAAGPGLVNASLSLKQGGAAG